MNLVQQIKLKLYTKLSKATFKLQSRPTKWEISSYLFSQNPTSDYLPSKSKNYKNVYYAGEICRPYHIFIISKEYAVNTSLRAVREFNNSENENFTKYSYIKEKYSTFPYILFGFSFFLFKFRKKIKFYILKYFNMYKKFNLDKN